MIETLTDNLKMDTGYFTATGRKSQNEDCAGVHVPEDSYLSQSKGVVLVVADGVSSAEAGKDASHTAVTRFLDEYYQTPDTWSAGHCGEKILSTINLRLYRKSHEFATECKGYLTTFSAIVVKSRTAHFFHIGDSRIFRLHRDESGELALSQLTRDHTAVLDENRATLSRALGMDNRLNVDYGRVPLEEGDVLLLTSDGVHDFIDESQIREILSQEKSAEEISRQLVDTALANDSDDNVSAVVARINQLPEESLDDYSVKLTRLPFPPELAPGMRVDGYEILRELFASSRSQLYLVRDTETGEEVAMKTPSLNFEDDISYIDRFIQEEWIGSRVKGENVVQIIRQARPRTCLYYLMEFVQGEGLDRWIEQHQPVSPKAAIAIVKQIAKGLEAFHDNEAIHQDLKPANVLITEEQRAVIVDFGSVYVAGLAELQRPLIHEGALGTASYSDPLYLLGKNPGMQGDVYALATITYEMFTGTLPYGPAVEECRTAFDYDRLRYQSAALHNPVIPVWFDSALERGVAFDLDQRYRTIEQLMTDLTQPNPEFLKVDPVTESSTSRLLFWKLLSGFWFITFLLLLYLFSQS
ncbi:bifunctional protein-serine/threonine kinase/phosphatase [Motiliproteus sp. MSK22-1]|uniref:bifunctional protein-serine/threonine kinase/phosphatase n=1 Tax=Motiliproteus sp. MSK22-1 TaxID=1897630 RepID=UPI0009771953|nr:bifunctional protein-serine/threonine kinase/phosphatase [Motiliproteus sp. MSK22-1]OMH28458.1 serine/threonine protein kinase [Motiliproteus sp. MSK22-1]